MKKAIRGRMYDTKTAHLLATWYSSFPINDFHYYFEELYQKKTGEYFLYGSGNAASPYRQRVELNTWRDGENIKPLSLTDARAWAEKHLDGDEYCAIFGDPEETDLTVTELVGIRLSPGARVKLKRMCAATEKTQGEIVERLILDAPEV